MRFPVKASFNTELHSDTVKTQVYYYWEVTTVKQLFINTA